MQEQTKLDIQYFLETLCSCKISLCSCIKEAKVSSSLLPSSGAKAFGPPCSGNWEGFFLCARRSSGLKHKIPNAWTWDLSLGSFRGITPGKCKFVSPLKQLYFQHYKTYKWLNDVEPSCAHDFVWLYMAIKHNLIQLLNLKVYKWRTRPNLPSNP